VLHCVCVNEKDGLYDGNPKHRTIETPE